MSSQTFELIQKESWSTKLNNFISLFWKLILAFLLITFFIGQPKEDNLDLTSDANFTFTYLDENGLSIKSETKNPNLTQVALIDITGLIAEENLGGILEPIQQKRSETIQKLTYLQRHPEIKGLILRINSPGGTVYDSDLIAEKVAELKDSGVLVVALLEEQATSGGYYIASQANQIIAHELTITGSIGSMVEIPNAKALLDKLGVQFNVIKSGEMKSMGGFYQNLSPEESEIFQGMITESYERFLDFVERGRQIERTKLKEIADGRIYTGKQAKDLNLIDELGRYKKAKEITSNLIKTEDIQVFNLETIQSPYNLFLESLGGISSVLQKQPLDFSPLGELNLHNKLFYL